jgi:hypothetical protein
MKSSQSWTRETFETLKEWISDELVQVRRQLHMNAILIVEKERRNVDVLVEFKEKGLIKEAQYMSPMLEAEAVEDLKPYPEEEMYAYPVLLWSET